MAPPGFKPAIPANEGSQTHALDRAATGLDVVLVYVLLKFGSKSWVCGRSLAGIVGSNPAGGMNVGFL